MNVAFVDLDIAYKDWKRTQPKGQSDMEELLVKRHINDALDLLVPANQDRPRMALLNVKNYTAIAPKGFVREFLIAASTSRINCSKSRFIEWVAKPNKDCTIKMALVCDTCSQTETYCECDSRKKDFNFIIDLESYVEQINYDDSLFERSKFTTEIINTMPYARNKKNPNFGKSEFVIVHPAEGSFFAANHYLETCRDMNTDFELGYRVELPHLIFNFKEGQIMLAYSSRPTNADGLMMVPDEVRVFKALRDYVDKEKFLFECKYGRGTDKFACEMWQVMQGQSIQSMTAAKGILRQSSPPQFRSMWKRIMNRRVPDYFSADNLNRRSPDYFDFVQNLYD